MLLVVSNNLDSELLQSTALRRMSQVDLPCPAAYGGRICDILSFVACPARVLRRRLSVFRNI